MNMWIIKDQASYQITSANLHKKGDLHQVWVERASGKTLLLHESTNEAEVREVKDAIDYAIQNKIPTLNL